MTKRKTDGSGKKKSSEAAQAAQPSLPPRAAMESVLSVFGGRRGRPIDQAQELMYQAWEAPSREGRVALARQALEISADCADAYVVLADEEAADVVEAIDLLRKGVAAGERALGKRAFKNDVGDFWGLLETRPYMRARAELARCLQEAGQREEALAHYRDLLRLNPDDNQGVRYVLATYLLDLGHDDELTELLGAYEGDWSAVWAYTAALVEFRQHGAGDAGPLLAAAKKINPFVPAYLLGRKKVPKRLPDYMAMGQDSEAAAYASGGVAAWKKTPGAIDWLRSSMGA